VIKGIKTSPTVEKELDRVLKGNPELAHVDTRQAVLSKQANTIEIDPQA
jgi:hypothetical protein